MLKPARRLFFAYSYTGKAICAQLYKSKAVGNYRELQELLYEDLRLYEDNIIPDC